MHLYWWSLDLSYGSLQLLSKFDPIPTCLFKFCVENITPVIIHIINISFELAGMITDAKQAFMLLHLKTIDHLFAQNIYRLRMENHSSRYMHNYELNCQIV